MLQNTDTYTRPPPPSIRVVTGKRIRLRLINIIWTGLSASERDAFVRRHLLAVWDAIERVTA